MRRSRALNRFPIQLWGGILCVQAVALQRATAQTAPDPDLVAYWSLDEPTRGVVGDSAGRSHGTHYAAPVVGVSGVCGTAYSFNGVDDGLTILNNLGSFGTGDFTITAWVNLTVLPQLNPTSNIFGQYAGNPYTLLVIKNDTGRPQFKMRDSNLNLLEATGTAPVNDGLWHFLAGVRNGGTARLYVDGTLAASETNAAVGTVTVVPSYLRIGAVTSAQGDPVPREEFFQGLIDEVKVYSRALTSEEVLHGFQNHCPARNPEHSLMAAWKLDETSGTTVADSVGASHGTSFGAAVGVPGVCGTAYSLDGVDDGLSLSNHLGNFGQGNFTITAWVNLTTLPQTYPTQTVFVHYAPGNTGLGVDNATGRPQFGMADPTGGLLLLYDAPGAINDGQWHYLAAVRNGGRASLYVDGMLGQSASNSNLGDVSAGGPSYVRIGGVSTGGGHLTNPVPSESFFQGLIDEVKVYGVALKGEEILFQFQNPCETPGDGNTQVGNEVPVEPAPGISLKFSLVTSAGTTTATTSSEGPAEPSGFRLGNPATYYDLTTTATFSGPVTVCIHYTGVSFGNESKLRLMHFQDGSWTNVTTSLDTANDVLCGQVSSLSPFAVLEPEDTDGDGLPDIEEAGFGTNPLVADTDGDGLLDGTEVDIAEGSGCPSATLPDSDADGLADGVEVLIDLTMPCSPDTDGDGVPDGVDPFPLDPGGNQAYVEAQLRDLAAFIDAVAVEKFTGPNANARAGRRTALSNRAKAAANETAGGSCDEAIEVLHSLLDRVDGAAPPEDWVVPGDERAEIAQTASDTIAILAYL